MTRADLAKFIAAKQAQRVNKSAPGVSDVHVNVPLTNMSIAYLQDESQFIADKVFPTIPVQHKSNTYYTFDKDAFMRDQSRYRAAGTESAGSGFTMSQDSYLCRVRAFHKDVDDESRANADSQVQLEESANQFVTGTLALGREIEWGEKYFTAGVWANEATPTTLWDNANSDPAKDIRMWKLAIKRSTTKDADVLTITPDVAEALKSHPKVITRYQYVNADAITMDMIAKLFELRKIYVYQAVVATGATGNGGRDATYDFVGGKHALLTVTPPRAIGQMTVAAGATFLWTGLLRNGMQTSKFRMEQIKSDRIEGEMAYDFKAISKDLAYFAPNVIA